MLVEFVVAKGTKAGPEPEAINADMVLNVRRLASGRAYISMVVPEYSFETVELYADVVAKISAAMRSPSLARALAGAP